MRWMDPNTQRGQKAKARLSVKKRKAGCSIRPKCFISNSQCLMHTILLFPSMLKSFSNISQLVLLSSLSVLPQKVWTTSEKEPHVPHAGTCSDPFLHPSPSKWMLHGSAAALHRQPLQSRLFCARLLQRGL